MHFDDSRRLSFGLRGQGVGGEAEVASLPKGLRDVFLRFAISHRHRRHEQPFAEPDLDGFEERRQPALDQIGDRLDLFHGASPIHLGEDPNQLIAAAGRLQLIQVGGQLAEFQMRSRSQPNAAAPELRIEMCPSS